MFESILLLNFFPLFIFQQQLFFITSIYSIVQSQNSVQESHVRPWQCAIRKSIFSFYYLCKVSMSSELPGGGYWYWMALGECFTAGLYLLRTCQLYILFSPFSREVWWKSVFVEDWKDENLLSALSQFYPIRSERQMTMCVLGGEGKEDVKETSLSDHPGASLAVSREPKAPSQLHTPPYSLRPAFLTGLTQVFHSRDP